MPELLDRCPHCGTAAAPDAAYCHRCGEPLIGAAPASGERPAEPAEGAVGGLGAEAAEVAEPLFGEGTAAGSGPATQHGDTGAADDPMLARALRGEYGIRMGDWMARGWNVFTRAGGLFIAFGAIVWLLFTFAGPILLLLGPLLMSGFLAGALIARRGEHARFSDFWLPFNDFVPLFFAWIVSCALLLAGILTCGILTIYLWVAYQFAYLLILDRRMEFWDALETSRKVAGKQWISLFAFAIILFLINLVAFLATASVGLILSLPLTSCFLVEAYADIFGLRDGVQRLPSSLGAPRAPGTPA